MDPKNTIDGLLRPDAEPFGQIKGILRTMEELDIPAIIDHLQAKG